MTRHIPPAGFRGGFLTELPDRAPYGMSTGPYRSVPAAVALPASVEDVQRLVRWSAAENVALIPRGSGTGMPGGNVGPWVTVSFGRARSPTDPTNASDAGPFGWIDPVDVASRTVRVGAGVTAARVQAAAEDVQLEYPPLPSSAPWATIGGMLSAGAAGARSFGLGAVGAWVQALEVVLPDGSLRKVERGAELSAVLAAEAAHAVGELARVPLADWPDVRKNASGYRLPAFQDSGDLVDLFVASEGTLGVITAATLRLRPRPQGRRLIVAGAPRLDDLEAWAEAARRVDAVVCEFIGPWLVRQAALSENQQVGHLVTDGGSLVMIEVEGDDEQMEEWTSQLKQFGTVFSTGGVVSEPSDGSSLWRLRKGASPAIQRAAERGHRSMQFIEDSVVPSARLGSYVEGVTRILKDADTDAALFGHCGDANVHVNPLIDVARPDWKQRVRRILDETVSLVAELGGTLSGEHGDGRVRTPFAGRIWTSETLGAFAALKAIFDPDGRMNPGVIVPLPGQDPLEALTSETPLVLHD